MLASAQLFDPYLSFAGHAHYFTSHNIMSRIEYLMPNDIIVLVWRFYLGKNRNLTCTFGHELIRLIDKVAVA